MLRGLNTRLDFAKAKLLLSIYGGDEDGVNDEMYAALATAESDGFHDGIAGRDMPALYRDEQPLAFFWEKGQTAGIEHQIMSDCPQCQDRDVLICPVHG